MNAKLLLCIFCAVLSQTFDRALAQGTAFTYQGRLSEGTNAVSGIYDLRFVICDASAGGNRAGDPLTNRAVAVNNGLLAATVDLSPGVFNEKQDSFRHRFTVSGWHPMPGDLPM